MPDQTKPPSALAIALGPRFRVSHPHWTRKVHVLCRRCFATWQLPRSHEETTEDASWLAQHECDPELLNDVRHHRRAA